MPAAPEQAPLRIGPFSEVVGVAPERLRTWEQRYGVPRPDRSPAGYRLYSSADRVAVEEMKRHLAAGRSPAEAASAVRQTTGTHLPPSAVESPEGEPHLIALRDELGRSLERFDTAAADHAFDRLLAGHSLATALRGALLPYLRELGERWARREVSIAQEHFVSRYLEGRLLALARAWDAGMRHVLLACLPGEQHTLGLLSFGLVLGGLGWRVTYFGADTPLDEVHRAAKELRADAVVLTSVMATRIRDALPLIAALASDHAVYLGGAGATEGAVRESGAIALPDDAVDGAYELAGVAPGAVA